MKKNDIEEFVSKTIDQVKKGLPKDCVLNGNFDFDISVTTERKTGGDINIHLAGVEHFSNTEHTHRIRFSITDKKSREKNIEYMRKFMKGFISDLSKLKELDE